MDEEAVAAFLAEVERVRASGILGRSVQLQRLFDFLVACRASGRVPKEIEVAVDCFERDAGTDVAQDATVRVAAHKLRKRLEDFYRAAGEPQRLTIPRGEYRLAMQPVAANAAPGTSPARWRGLLPASLRERLFAATALLCLLAAALAFTFAMHRPGQSAAPGLATLRDSNLWGPVLADDLPVQLVLGDYYIFGERDEQGRIQRLVREFNINSRRQLEQGFVGNPERARQYTDLNLGYLPTSSAQALREVLPVIMSAGKPVMLTLASELDPATFKSTHVVYLGYLSGMGMLEDMVLAASRYSIGGSYDELIDSVSGAARVSEAGEAHPPGTRYVDYAYLAALRGPGGHMHLVIAGTRDVGLMQAAELAADQGRLKDLQAALPPGAFEALYEVQGLNGINVEVRLLDASPAPAQARVAP
jgi:hypothetical protein